jgi:hypothetical protein
VRCLVPDPPLERSQLRDERRAFVRRARHGAFVVSGLSRKAPYEDGSQQREQSEPTRRRGHALFSILVFS